MRARGLRSRLYDSSQIDKENMLYPSGALMALLIPIVVEQLLNSLMGMVDTMMVSNVGSEAISAVSLVDSINNLVIQIFSAMAAGASILCSQYLGGGDREGCNRAARQVVLTVLTISLGVTLAGLCLRASAPADIRQHRTGSHEQCGEIFSAVSGLLSVSGAV